MAECKHSTPAKLTCLDHGTNCPPTLSLVPRSSCRHPATRLCNQRSIWAYRLNMLLWSLWLVFVLFKWVAWSWRCFSQDKIWHTDKVIAEWLIADFGSLIFELIGIESRGKVLTTRTAARRQRMCTSTTICARS